MKIYHKLLLSLLLYSPILLTQPNTTLWQADAGETKVNLLELYTSQGCHSCPPAEKLMNSLDNNPRLWKDFIPLALHVDYWNYIGWKDPFSSPQYSKRQRYHRTLGNIQSVYTPGWLINGKEWHGFFTVSKERIPHLSYPSIPLNAELNNKGYLTVTIPYESKNPTPKPALLYTAILGSGYTHNITSGENNGKKLDSNFVVLKLSEHKIRNKTRWQIPLPKVEDTENSKKMALAIWLSDRNLKPIQAVGNWIDKSLVVKN